MRTLFLGMIAASIVVSGPAMAKAGPADAKAAIKIEPSVKKLPFGKDVKATLKWVRRHMAKQRGASATRIAERLKALRKSVVYFKPGADVTALKKSAIGDQFRVGNGESMLRYDDGKHSHYFFFYNGKLFRYAKPVMVPPKTAAFVDRIQTLTKSLGAPTGTYAPDGGDNVVEARWVKKTVETRIVDKRASHNADVLVVEHVMSCRKVEAARRGTGGNYAVDDDLKEFLE